MQNKSRAFTLIELLVVVLIIGILTAIALPKYQVAVGKTKAMQLYMLLKSFQKAEQAYYLANGNYTQDADELDISYPAGSTKSGKKVVLRDGTRIFFEAWFLFAATDKVQLQVDYGNGFETCWASSDTVSQQICATMGKKTSEKWETCSGLGKQCQEYRLGN